MIRLEYNVFLTVDWLKVSKELTPSFSEGVDLLVDDLSFWFLVRFLVVKETMVTYWREK